MNLAHILFPKGYSSQFQWIQSSFSLLMSTVFAFICLSFFHAFFESHFTDSDKDGYYMITKPIGLSNTLFGSTSSFNEKEINVLKESSFVKELAFVKTPAFNCKARFFEKQNFSTDLVLESIPKKMLDQANFRFYWDEEKDKVPIIISADFLRIYNFVYAPIAGLPPVSIENLSYLPVILSISGNSKRQSIKAEIVGVTDRYNGLFVPESFMNWANTNFSKSQESRKNKLILRVKSGETKAFESYLKTKSLESNMENLRMGKAAALVYPLLSGFLILIVFFILISVSNFWFQWKWLLGKQEPTIQILYLNGMAVKEVSHYIAKKLFTYIALILLIALILGSIIWYSFLSFFGTELGIQGFGFPLVITINLILTYALIYLWLYFAVNKFCKAAYN